MRLFALLLAAAALFAAPRQELVYRTTPQGDLKIHLFYPEGWQAADRRPAIVFFFGGGFRSGSPQQFFTKARYLASRGMVAASAEYRILNKHKTTPAESIEDCRAAVAWMRQNATSHGIDASKIAAGGGSAGGTCAADTHFSANAAERPDALVLFNPAMESEPLGELQPIRMLKGAYPPTVMFFGTADGLIAGATKFLDLARQSKSRVEMYLANDQKHGFFNERDGDYSWHASTIYVADRFLSTLGYTQGLPTIAMPPESKAVLRPYVRAPVPPTPRPIPPGIRVERDITFRATPSRPLKLDLYLPEKSFASKLPLVVWIHGGAWLQGSKENPPSLWLVERGYATASIGYRLSQEAPFPAQLEDCKAAIEWLRANAGKYGYDPARIAVWGGSAGGHLVSMLGTDRDARVQAVVNYYGPSDLLRMSDAPSAMNHDSPDSPESLLIGAVLQRNPELARKASPLTFVSAQSAPFLHVHGDADQLVPYEQSEMLHAALKAAKVESELVILPGARHGGPEFNTPEIRAKIEAFLARHVKK